jgi:hypothetical protein
MTLCIAAECECDGLPTILMCADWRAQTGNTGGPLIGTEDTYKIMDLGAMSVLISGRPSDARQLIVACKDAVRRFGENSSGQDSDLVISDFQRDLRKAAANRKKEIVEDYVDMTLGMSYAEFRQTRTEHWHESHVEVFERIKRLDLGTDLIFCGFCSSVPVIIRLDRFGYTPWETNYSVIGEGAEIARAILCLQPWSKGGCAGYVGEIEPMPLDYCFFRLYEAKTVAHVANPSVVGSATAFEALVSGKGRYSLRGDLEIHNIFQEKHMVPIDRLASLWFGVAPNRRSNKRIIKARKGFDLLTEPVKNFPGPSW